MKNNIELGLGKLKKTKPSSLVPESGEVQSFDSFFLTLALIFNDIKGLVYFNRFVNSKMLTNVNGVSSVQGECCGLSAQLFKIATSCLSETMIFLEKNEDIINSDKFVNYLRSLSVKDREIWNLLSHVTFNSKNKETNASLKEFKNLLVKIRSNVSFHYYQSSKPLVAGFREHFFLNKKIAQESREHAYYSIKKSDFDSNRFYYADAALTAYINKTLGDYGDAETVTESIIKLSAYVSIVIASLLSIYLGEKPNL